MHAIVVVQPLSAMRRTNSPKPSSSAFVHSVLVMRHGPGCAGCRLGRSATSAGNGAGGGTLTCVVVQPTTPSVATSAQTLMVFPPLPEGDVRQNVRRGQFPDRARRLHVAQIRLRAREANRSAGFQP